MAAEPASTRVAPPEAVRGRQSRSTGQVAAAADVPKLDRAGRCKGNARTGGYPHSRARPARDRLPRGDRDGDLALRAARAADSARRRRDRAQAAPDRRPGSSRASSSSRSSPTWLLDKLGLPDDLLRNLAIALLFLVAATLLVPAARAPDRAAVRPPHALPRRRRRLPARDLARPRVRAVRGPRARRDHRRRRQQRRRLAGDRAHAQLRDRRRAADAADRDRRPRGGVAAARRRRRGSASRPGS